MHRFLLLVVAFSSTVSASETVSADQYRFYVELARNKTDVSPKDGKFSCSEFTALIDDMLLIGCPPAEETQPPRGDCIYAAQECIASDANSDGFVTEEELIDFITEKANSNSDTEYNNKILNLFIKGLTSVNLDFDNLVEGIGEVNPCIVNSKASLTVSFTSPQPLDQFLPGERKLATCNIEFALGLRTSVLPCTPDPCTKFNLRAGSTVISTKFYFPTTAAANAAGVVAQTKFGTKEDAEANSGIPVESVEPPVVEAVAGNYEIEFPVIGGAGGGFLILSCLTIAAAMSFSTSKRAKFSPPVPPEQSCGSHCCNTGCCSVYAIYSWSWSLVIGVIGLAVSTVFLFLAVTPIKDSVICIIDGIYDLQAIGKNVTAVGTVADAIPITFLDPVRERLNLLDIAVILPAAIAGLCLIIAALLSARTSTSMCCAKFFNLLSYLFLLIGFVLYVVFASLAIAINYQETVKGFVQQAVSICDDNVPLWAQTLQDAIAARDRARSNGQDTSDYDVQINSWNPAVLSLGSTCECLTGLFNQAPALFVPGMTTVLIIIYLYFASITWCCSAKCCKSPMITGKVTKGTTVSGDDISKTSQSV